MTVAILSISGLPHLVDLLRLTEFAVYLPVLTRSLQDNRGHVLLTTGIVRLKRVLTQDTVREIV